MAKLKIQNATLYRMDGTQEKILLNSDATTSSLEYLQKLVGGYIEVVHLNGNDLVINEEGLLLDLEPNPWSYYVTKGTDWKNQYFFGDMILIEGRLT